MATEHLVPRVRDAVAQSQVVSRLAELRREAILEQTSVLDFSANAAHAKAYVEFNEVSVAADPIVQYMSKAEMQKSIDKTRKDMAKAAKDMDFLMAARLRDEMFAMEKIFEERFAK